MTGKKKKKKDGRKLPGDQVPGPATSEKLTDAISHGSSEDKGIVSPSKRKPEVKVKGSSVSLVEIVEPVLSLAVPQICLPFSVPQSLTTEGTSAPELSRSTSAFTLSDESNPGPSFVFSAGQNSAPKRIAATPAIFSAQATECTTVHYARNSKQTARRREGKCPPSERFGKMGKSRQQILQFAAQEVAFGQGRDPLSLVVSYEENGLRRIVKVPEGCTSETIVDSTLRQAVAGAALDSAGWQEALNHPKEDGYFAYSTAPEGLTVAKFRDVKGKVLVTPLSGANGLLKLKEDAEKKRKAAEEVLESVREYLQRLESEDEKFIACIEVSEEKNSGCTHCKSMRSELKDLLKIVTQTPSGDTKGNSEIADMLQSEEGQGTVLASPTALV